MLEAHTGLYQIGNRLYLKQYFQEKKNGVYETWKNTRGSIEAAVCHHCSCVTKLA